MIAAALFCMAAAVSATGAPRTAAPTLSERLTAAAEELLKIEKKIAATNEGLMPPLYEDVLSLLNEAITEDPSNLHARALASEVLLLRSDQGDGTFDICSLLDARDEAEYVLRHGGDAADAATARGTLRAIQAIPPDAIPDSPSSCGESEEQRHGSKTRSS